MFIRFKQKPFNCEIAKLGTTGQKMTMTFQIIYNILPYIVPNMNSY